MPGWLRAATVAASRWKRWRKLASVEYCSASTLMATGISRRGCVDRYTTPMAPRPSSASIGYLPSCVVLTLGLARSQYAARCGAAQTEAINKPSLSGCGGSTFSDRYRPGAQDLLVELADRGLGHLVDEPHLVGQPPLGDFVLEELDDLFLGDLPFELGLWHRVRDRALVPLGVRQADHGRLQDLGVRHDRVLEID